LKKADLIDEVVSQTGLPKRQVTEVIELSLQAMAAALRKHEKVQLVGFGAFEPRPRNPRLARNPRTQEEITVGASWSLLFRPSKQLRASLGAKTATPTLPPRRSSAMGA
jgi:DNA-binding protein HU-beta